MEQGRCEEEVPQWVRDFIARRREQLIEQDLGRECGDIAQRVEQSPYLICPFTQQEEEAVRAGVIKLRYEELAAELQRKSPFPSTPIDESSPLAEWAVRELLLVPSTKQEMQEAVARYYGWAEWEEDPWGNYPQFCEWMRLAGNDARAVWAVNETLGGRFYLFYYVLEDLVQSEYSEMSGAELVNSVGLGALNFLKVKAHTGWDEFLNHYPVEPLPPRLVNERMMKALLQSPFTAYWAFVSSIYDWLFALNVMIPRIRGNLKLGELIEWYIISNPDVLRITLILDPGYHPRSEDEIHGILGLTADSDPSDLDASALRARYKAFTSMLKSLPDKGPELLDKGKYCSVDAYVAKTLRSTHVNELAEFNPQYAKFRDKELKARRAAGKYYKEEFDDEIAEKYKKDVPEWEKDPLSLQWLQKGENVRRNFSGYTEDEQLCLEDAITGDLSLDNQFYTELKEELIAVALDTAAGKTPLTWRHRLVVDLTREGRNTTEIALALERKAQELGKPVRRRVSAEAVYQLKRSAIKRVQEAAITIGNVFSIENLPIVRQLEYALGLCPYRWGDMVDKQSHFMTDRATYRLTLLEAFHRVMERGDVTRKGYDCVQQVYRPKVEYTTTMEGKEQTINEIAQRLGVGISALITTVRDTIDRASLEMIPIVFARTIDVPQERTWHWDDCDSCGALMRWDGQMHGCETPDCKNSLDEQKKKNRELVNRPNRHSHIGGRKV